MKTPTLIPTLATMALSLAAAALLVTAAPASARGPPAPQRAQGPIADRAGPQVLNTANFGDPQGPLSKVKP